MEGPSGLEGMWSETSEGTKHFLARNEPTGKLEADVLERPEGMPIFNAPLSHNESEVTASNNSKSFEGSLDCEDDTSTTPRGGPQGLENFLIPSSAQKCVTGNHSNEHIKEKSTAATESPKYFDGSVGTESKHSGGPQGLENFFASSESTSIRNIDSSKQIEENTLSIATPSNPDTNDATIEETKSKCSEACSAPTNRKDRSSPESKERGMLQDLLIFKDKENERQSALIQKLQMEILKKRPPVEDVCLSARSFSEKDAVRFRDMNIEGLQGQIELLNDENTKLHENVLYLENEMERLQKELLSKDVFSSGLQEKLVSHERKLELAKEQLSKLNGRENAIAVSMKQNTQLLLLLQQKEALVERLESEKQATLDEFHTVSEAFRQVKESTALASAMSTWDSAEKKQLTSALERMNEVRESERSEMQSKIRALEVTLHDSRTNAQDELSRSQSKQFQLLAEREKLEGLLQREKDRNETMSEQINALMARIRQLESANQKTETEAQLEEKKRDVLDEHREEVEEEIVTDLHTASQLIVALRNELRETRASLSDREASLLESKKSQRHLEKRLRLQDETITSANSKLRYMTMEVTRQGRQRIKSAVSLTKLKARLERVDDGFSNADVDSSKRTKSKKNDNSPRASRRFKDSPLRNAGRALSGRLL